MIIAVSCLTGHAPSPDRHPTAVPLHKKKLSYFLLTHKYTIKYSVCILVYLKKRKFLEKSHIVLSCLKKRKEKKKKKRKGKKTCDSNLLCVLICHL